MRIEHCDYEGKVYRAELTRLGNAIDLAFIFVEIEPYHHRLYIASLQGGKLAYYPDQYYCTKHSAESPLYIECDVAKSRRQNPLNANFSI